MMVKHDRGVSMIEQMNHIMEALLNDDLSRNFMIENQ